ncbi:hypothetical protein BDN72DRAFT_944548, partial [Pluteus cervinus]
QLHDEGANESLIRFGFLGSAPSQPSVAFTLELLEFYHQLRHRQSNFSTQAIVRVLCSLHNLTYTKTLRTHFSNTFDAYLEILRNIQQLVDDALGRNKTWRAKNGCPACSFKLPNEPKLEPARLHAMDGNNSLKHFHGKAYRDDREFSSNYFIQTETVDLYKDVITASTKRGQRVAKKGKRGNKVEFEDVEVEQVLSCADGWTASSSVSEDTVKVFDETGIFLSMCRHAIVEFIVDMRKSGELAKYGLATVHCILDTYGAGQCLGYDIGCTHHKTVAKSPLNSQARELKLEFVVDLFHGYSHERSCQLNFLPLYRPACGIEDFATCERIFSSLNSAVRLIRHASHFHWLQHIDLHFNQWDQDHYQDLTKFIHDNYRQALKIIEVNVPKLDDFKATFGFSGADFESWYREEKAYLSVLTETEPLFDKNLIVYVEALQELKDAEKKYNNSQENVEIVLFVASDFQNGQLSASARQTGGKVSGARTRLRTRYKLALDTVDELESVLDIDGRWTREHPKYAEVLKFVKDSEFIGVVERLEALIVQRLFELSKANLSGTGVKLRKKVSDSIIHRSKAIQGALKKYNELAPLQRPPRPTVEYDNVITWTTLGQFTLLKDSRYDPLSKPWSINTNREMANRYWKVQGAHAEIVRLNVETARMEEWIRVEDEEWRMVAATLSSTNAALAHQVQLRGKQRQHINSIHRCYLDAIYAIPGYTGTIPPNCTPSAPTLLRAEEDDDEALEELGMRLGDFLGI